MPKARGSAILIAIMLVTAIGTIAFAFGHVLLEESSVANLYENGVGAYYAAESGIEEGFLRYRYNRNEEVPFKDWKLADTKVFRSNMGLNSVSSTTSGGTVNAGINRLTTAITDDSKQYYDLRMGFIGYKDKWPFFGYDSARNDNQLTNDDILFNPSPTEFFYPKDQSLSITFPKEFSFRGNDLTLFAKFVGASSTDYPRSDKSIIEAKVIVRLADGTTNQYKKMITSNLPGTEALLSAGDDSSSIYSQTIQLEGCGNSNDNRCIWSVGGLILAVDSNMVVPDGSVVTLSLTPLYYDAYLELIGDKCLNNGCSSQLKSMIMPGPYTMISSAGYYGGATRTIEADIDRQSGSLYDLFDYVIYKAQ